MSQNPDDPSLLDESMSLLLDFTPFVGSGKSAIEVVNGKDMVTGVAINRWLAAGGIILGFIPFGKLLIKGKKAGQTLKAAMGHRKAAEEIAARIAYDATSKKDLLKKMEKVIPGRGKDVDYGFIMQEIRGKVRPSELLHKFGVKHDPLHSVSDMNLVQQYLVQMRYGGHAVQKHWIAGDRRKLLESLSRPQQKKVTSRLDDSDEVFEYLKLVLKDRNTVKVSLPHSQHIGFANAEKKVLILHNPDKAGTFRHAEHPIKDLEEIFKKEQSRLSK